LPSLQANNTTTTGACPVFITICAADKGGGMEFTMDVSEMIVQGLKYMGIGVSVVFVVLAVFFVVIKLLMKIWPPEKSG